MKNSNKRLRILLAALVANASIGCASLSRPGMPPPPKGDLCTHRKSAAVAKCAELGSGAARPSVPIEMTDKWIMFSPFTWESVMNYLMALERAVDQKSGPIMVQSSDIKIFRSKMNRAKAAALR